LVPVATSTSRLLIVAVTRQVKNECECEFRGRDGVHSFNITMLVTYCVMDFGSEKWIT
jgi:hypothetical protein